MDTQSLSNVLAEGLALITVLSLIPILCATIVGILVSVFQALTQIQEQNLAFTAKLVVIIITLWASGQFMADQLFQYTVSIFDLLY